MAAEVGPGGGKVPRALISNAKPKQNRAKAKTP